MNAKKLIKTSKAKLASAYALMLFMLGGATAYADTGSHNTITALFTSWHKTAMHALIFVQFVSGFAGMVLIVMGLFQLRTGHGGQQGGQQIQTKNGFIHLLLGGSLLVVGTIAAVLGHTMNSGVTDTITSTLSVFSNK